MAQTAAERRAAQRATAKSVKSGGKSPIAGMGAVAANAAAKAPSSGSASLADIRDAHRGPTLQPKQFGTTVGGGVPAASRTTAVSQTIQRPLSAKAGGKSPYTAGGKVGSSITAPLSGIKKPSAGAAAALPNVGPTPAAVPGAAVGGSPTGKAGRSPKGRAGKGPAGRAKTRMKKMFLPKGSKHSGNNAKHLDNMTG